MSSSSSCLLIDSSTASTLAHVTQDGLLCHGHVLPNVSSFCQSPSLCVCLCVNCVHSGGLIFLSIVRVLYESGDFSLSWNPCWRCVCLNRQLCPVLTASLNVFSVWAHQHGTVGRILKHVINDPIAIFFFWLFWILLLLLKTKMVFFKCDYSSGNWFWVSIIYKETFGSFCSSCLFVGKADS